MKINNVTLFARVQKPIKIMHITDLHLTLSDCRDDEYCRDHAAHRSGVFSINGKNPAQEAFDRLLLASNDADILLLTGDIVDFPSQANIEYVTNKLQGRRFIYCHGNHDWNYPRDYPFGTTNWDFDQSVLYENAISKTREVFYPLTSGDIDVFVYNGLKVLAINNSNYRFSPLQAKRIEQELADGMDTVIAFHIPLYAQGLIKDTLDAWNLPIICGGNDSVHAPYWSYRTDQATAEACRLIGESPNVVGVITGHLHFDHVDTLPGGNTQYVTAFASRGNATLFTVLPLNEK